ncbi:hypothetical protein HHI36_022383, partial [Cryptolaemus montrouzieri]
TFQYTHFRSEMPLLQPDMQSRSWEKHAMDILNFRHKEYLVIVDYYGKWIELKNIRCKKVKEIIKTLNVVFSWYP